MRIHPRQIFLFVLTLTGLLVAPGIIGAHAATSYTAGVKPGDSALYARSSGVWNLSGPPQAPISQFIQLNYTSLQVAAVTGDNVTATQLFSYTNGTQRTFGILGSVATDSGNITFWFIARNLTAGDPLYTTPNSPTINQTITRSFAGAERTVNVFNSTQTPAPGVFTHVEAWWDQATGILLHVNFFHLEPGGFASLNAELVQTNIWSPGPGIGMFANPDSITINPGETGTSTLFFISERGFNGTVGILHTITCFSNCPTISVNPVGVVLTSGGVAFANVTFTTTNATNPGFYTATFQAISGFSPLNSTIITLQVTGQRDRPPIANFFYSPQPGVVGQSMFFNAASSFDPDGFITNYSWNFGDGLTGTGEFPSHTYFNPGNYTVTLMVTDNVGLTTATTQLVFVVQPIAHDVGIISVSAFPNIAISGQTISFSAELVDRGLQQETVDVKFYYGSQVAATLTGITIPVTQYPYYINVLWNTAGVAPGNYTISATVFLDTDQNPSNNHMTDGQVIILPPPILVASPTSGPVGTKVMLHGTGFPSNGPIGYPVTVDVTFDDQFVGFTTMTNGTFTFTFNVPVSQTGIHEINAYAQFYPSAAEASTSFTVTPTPTTGGASLTVTTGAVYFPGDAVSIYLLTTLGGKPTTSQTITLTILLPNGTSRNLPLTLVIAGVYKATFGTSSRSTIGTYALVANAQIGNINASALTTFEVKPTWLQSNGRNVTTASIIGAVGAVSVLGLAWQKGYFGKKKDEYPAP